MKFIGLSFFVLFFSLIGTAANLSQLNRYHFVFISGYSNESIPGYFDENIRILNRLGAKRVSVINPSSLYPVTTNVEVVRSQLKYFYHQSPQTPLVVVAHSKGGLEMINTLLRYRKEFPQQVLAKVFFVQAPLVGSPYTDEYLKPYKSSTCQLNPVCVSYSLTYLQGMFSMETHQILADLKNSAKGVTAVEAMDLSRRIYYIRSYKEYDKVTENLKQYAKILKDINAGVNDGLVPTEKQIIRQFLGRPVFGTDLGVQYADHVEFLIMGKNPTPARLQSIRKFTEQLAQWTVGL